MTLPPSPNDFVILPLEERLRLNGNLTSVGNKTMIELIGSPRATYTSDDQPVTDARIKRLIVTENVGPFRVTGLKPAVETVRAVMQEISALFPDVYSRLGTAGMLSCRLVRGSATSISNHAWGTAIDLTYAGALDGFGDGRIQQALLDIFPVFRRHQFFWGAAFRREDAMHFEASEQLIRRWAAEGQFGELPPAASRSPTFGDRGPRIEAIQLALNRALESGLTVDGVFGKDTRAAVMEFQRRRQLRPDGIVTAPTLAALGLS